MFVGFLKTFGKTNKTTNKQKNISKGGSETSNNFGLLVFPKVCLVFFGIFGFPECVCWFSKNHRENQKNKKTKKTYPRVGLKPLKALFFGFLEGCLGFCLVFFCIVGFPECVCWFSLVSLVFPNVLLVF